MLPQSRWRQTGLGRSAWAAARAPGVGAPNAQLVLDTHGPRRAPAPGSASAQAPAPDPGSDETVAVPVLSLDPEALGAWACMLTDPSVGVTTAYLLRPAPPPSPTAAPTKTPKPVAESITPLERIDRFARSASRPARSSPPASPPPRSGCL